MKAICKHCGFIMNKDRVKDFKRCPNEDCFKPMDYIMIEDDDVRVTDADAKNKYSEGKEERYHCGRICGV